MSEVLTKRRWLALTGGLALSGAASTLIAKPAPIIVRGAGSTFVNPILSKWTLDYMANYHVSGGTKIEYQPVGSGAGIDMIKARKVDFGTSDMPLMPQELARFDLGQFPLVIGGVVPVVNLPGMTAGRMRLTGVVLAGIYLGKITQWNDPAIGRINPGLTLPAVPIAVVHRSDGSGTTFNWVNYLCKQSPEWKARVGEGTTVEWPTGLGGKGNDGVSDLVKQTPNSIGYVEFAYAVRSGLAWALLQNRAGNFVAPGVKSFQAAAEGVNWRPDQDFYQILTDAPGKLAYPITATAFVLMPKKLKDYSRNRALLDLFQWAFEEGQASALALGYVPLPSSLTYKVEAYWTTDIKH